MRPQQVVVQICGLAMIGTLAVLLGFRELLFVDPETHLWADDFDPQFLRWTAEWGYQALTEMCSWESFWNPPIFYPHKGTLAYSDSLLTLQILYSPLRLIGFGPHTALFISLGAFAVLGFTLTVILLRKLTLFSTAESILIGITSHFSLVMWAFLPHYQLFGFHFAPPFLLALYLFCSTLKLRWLFVAELLFLLGACFSAYLAPSLILMGSAIIFTTAPTFLRGFVWRNRIHLMLSATLLSVAFATVFYFSHARYYARMVKTTTEQSLDEVTTYSANPSSLISGRSIHSHWWKPYGGHYSNVGDWERAYFPGFIILLGSVLGLASLLLPAETENRNLRFFYFSMFGTALAALVLSWGPSIEGHKTPFYYLTQAIPIFKNTRAMGRFGMFLGLPLGVFLVAGLRFAMRLKFNPQSIVALPALMSIAVLVESIPTGRILPYHMPLKERYEVLSTLIKPKTPVVELPCHGKNHFETIRRILEQMNGALYHRGWITVGYSGRSSPETAALIHKDQQLASGALSWEEMLKYLHHMGTRAILINKDRYAPSIANSLAAEIAQRANYQVIDPPTPDYIILQAMADEVAPEVSLAD